MEKVISALLLTMVILSGCTTGDGIDKKVYLTLESVEDKELELKKTFNQLAQQEVEEAKIYQSLVENQENEEAVDTYMVELESSIDQRKSLLEKESKLIKGINEDLLVLKEIKHENELLNDLENEIEERNQHFELYEKSYSEQLLFLSELIKGFNGSEVDENESFESVLEKLDKVNQTIQKQMQLFNQATDEMNVLKKEYYKKIDIQL